MSNKLKEYVQEKLNRFLGISLPAADYDYAAFPLRQQLDDAVGAILLDQSQSLDNVENLSDTEAVKFVEEWLATND